MSTIEINGADLYYESTGRGPALLFVHGLCGDADSWVDQAERFSDRYRCVRYDRRGHTRSGRGSAPVSWALHAADAVALVEALDLAPCLLVGSSSGAAIALDVALRHGDLLRGCVVSEPPLWSLAPAAGEAFLAELTPVVDDAIAVAGPRGVVDAFFSVVCPGLWATIDETRKDNYRDNADIGLADLRSPPFVVTREDLSSTDLPTLVISGDASHRSFGYVTEVLAALPEARFVQLEDCGHVTYAERPEEFASAVAGFAAEIDRAEATAAR